MSCLYCKLIVVNDTYGWGFDDKGEFHLECLEMIELVGVEE